MAKIISERLLKPGIDKLPSGPTMFSRRNWSESDKSSQTSADGTPESAQADPNLEMKPAMDAHEAEFRRLVDKAQDPEK